MGTQPDGFEEYWAHIMLVILQPESIDRCTASRDWKQMRMIITNQSINLSINQASKQTSNQASKQAVNQAVNLILRSSRQWSGIRGRIHQPFFRTFFVLLSRFFYIYKHLNVTELLIG